MKLVVDFQALINGKYQNCREVVRNVETLMEDNSIVDIITTAITESPYIFKHATKICAKLCDNDGDMVIHTFDYRLNSIYFGLD